MSVMMRVLLAALNEQVASISIPSDWGGSNGASPQTSAAKTLTVPVGNPGDLTWLVITNDATLQYKKNSGVFNAVSDSDVVNFADGDTLTFKFSGISGSVASMSVYDNTTGELVGSFQSVLS